MAGGQLEEALDYSNGNLTVEMQLTSSSQPLGVGICEIMLDALTRHSRG